MKNKYFNFIFIFCSVFALFFYSIPEVFAGSVTIKNPNSINVDKTFEVVLYVDTDKQSINSVDMVLDYNQDLLNFAGYKSDSSIVKMWIDAPHESNGTVVFAGIIPGGVSGVFDVKKSGLTAIPLVTLLFKTENVGLAEFYFSKSNILINDGLGTELIHNKTTSQIEIKNAIIKEEEIPPSTDPKSFEDIVKPEPFEITFIKSSLFSRTPSMIAFDAFDNDSGIEFYEIKINEGAWQKVESPYPVPKSLFSQILTVRAVDFQGNARESSTNTLGFIDGNLRLNLWVAVLVAVLIIGVFMRKVLNLKNKG